MAEVRLGFFIEKNRFPAIAARHHMIERAREFNTNAPRH
jgi:hypothetical protein